MPEVFPLLRVLADRPRTPARFLVLGSASPELLRQPSETLAGRVAYHELGGFGLQEVGDPERLWLRGGLPLSYLARSAPASRRWRDGFIRTFLTRDVPGFGSSIPSPTLRRFWTMLAHWHGQTWNGAEFGRAFGVAHTTVRRYLDLLTSVFVVRQLQPWYEDIRKRQVRSPKVYIADSGILHALLGLSTREAVGAQGVFADANARRPRTFRVGHADVGGIRLTVLGYPQRAGKIGELQVGSRRRDLVPSHHARIEVRHLPDGGNPPQLHEPVRGAGKPEPAGLSVAGALAGHLCSHFIDIGSERVLVLGCHDLLLFSGRGRPSANGPTPKEIRREHMGTLAGKYKPTVILHHPPLDFRLTQSCAVGRFRRIPRRFGLGGRSRWRDGIGIGGGAVWALPGGAERLRLRFGVPFASTSGTLHR